MMKTSTLLFALSLAGITLASCKKNKDNDIPPVNTVTGQYSNIDGKKIKFTSSSGNSASFFPADKELDMRFIDGNNQIEISTDILGIEVGDKGSYPMNGDSTNSAYVYLPSNPSGQRDFCTCADFNGDFVPEGSGTIIIQSFTKDQVTGTLKDAKLLNSNPAVPAITIYNCKFNLKIK